MIMKKQVIKIRDLKYTYPDRTEALQGLNLDIFEGESVGLIGPNGAGKSTFLLHLNGILQGRGMVEIMGTEVKQNPDFARNRVCLVFQDPDDQLFMPTVFDDVAFGPVNLGLNEQEVQDRVNKALAQVDVTDLAQRVTHHLSFGEKKRVSIATGLSMDPDILVLDEPSSNLDPKSRRDLIVLLEKFDHTKIITGHDLELILDICERTIVLDKGKIAADGQTKDILSNKSLMKAHSLEVPLSLRNSQ